MPVVQSFRAVGESSSEEFIPPAPSTSSSDSHDHNPPPPPNPGPLSLSHQGPLALSYHVEGLVSLLSDGVAHKVPIARLDFTAELKYVCVPRKNTAVFIEGTIENTSEYELLPGPVSVYMDDGFVTKTAYEMLRSDWSSDVCSSDLPPQPVVIPRISAVPVVQSFRAVGESSSEEFIPPAPSTSSSDSHDHNPPPPPNPGPLSLSHQGPLALSYHVEGLVSLPSDGVAHKVPIARLDFTAELKYVCVPRKNTAVFIEGTIENTSEYELLPGPVSVYMDDGFITKTSFDVRVLWTRLYMSRSRC